VTITSDETSQCEAGPWWENATSTPAGLGYFGGCSKRFRCKTTPVRLTGSSDAESKGP